MPPFPMRETITRLRQRIETTSSINQEDQNSLLKLIGDLETEAGELEQHPASEQVRKAIDGADGPVNETSDDSSGPLESLQSAIREVEAAHPQAAEILARIGNILGRMGI